jgi:hypothetical protein
MINTYDYMIDYQQSQVFLYAHRHYDLMKLNGGRVSSLLRESILTM